LPNNEQSIDIKMNILQENHKNYTWINNCYIDFITKNQYSYHYYALMIIKILKFDISNLNIEIQNDEFINNLDLCCKWIFENKDIITKKYEMNKITNIPEKLNSKLKIINTILLSMYGIKIIYNKVSNIYKLSDNNIWVSLPFIPVSKMLELKEDNLENNIDDIDTSGLDIIR
jgi:hypothetical protein